METAPTPDRIPQPAKTSSSWGRASDGLTEGGLTDTPRASGE